MKTKMSAVLILLLAFALIATPVSALVEGATVTDGIDSEATPEAAGSDAAAGGYITSLDISANTQTSMWQGYFGNVTGYLTLENSVGNQLFNWTYDDTGGEVFASTASDVAFTSIAAENVSDADGRLSWTASAVSDAVADTFSDGGSHSAIEIGRTTIAANDAAVATMADANFVNVILTDGTTTVWTAIINPNTAGFDSANHDFELIVPEDNAGNSVTTTYYFYTELT